jgi:hypothetical protein
MRRARSKPDVRDVGSLTDGDGADVGDIDLARDHLAADRDDDRCHQRQRSLLVGDQHAKMLSLAVSHGRPVVCLSAGVDLESVVGALVRELPVYVWTHARPEGVCRAVVGAPRPEFRYGGHGQLSGVGDMDSCLIDVVA